MLGDSVMAGGRVPSALTNEIKIKILTVCGSWLRASTRRAGWAQYRSAPTWRPNSYVPALFLLFLFIAEQLAFLREITVRVDLFAVSPAQHHRGHEVVPHLGEAQSHEIGVERAERLLELLEQHHPLVKDLVLFVIFLELRR